MHACMHEFLISCVSGNLLMDVFDWDYGCMMHRFLSTGYQNNLKVLYSSSKTPASSRKTTRHIPQVPERILDAPEIIDDYCKSLSY